jgi:ketosteroid isomerase-like protein
MDPMVRRAQALFEAFQAGDERAVYALCSPDCQAIQNGGPAMTLQTLLRFSARVRSLMRDFRYEDCRRMPTPEGFVEEHRVCGTLPDGTVFEMIACIVADVRDDRITELREYFDSAQATRLAEALAARPA